jgi:signal recognition particle receptor subunit alpha
MLEQFLIFTRGGLVLWSCLEVGKALKGSPVDALIRTCLLEERAGDSSFQYDTAGAGYTLKWRFHNELGLVFVAVYQRMLHLLYVDELLEKVMREFSMLFVPTKTTYHEFDDTYRHLLKEAEANSQLKRAGQHRPIENSKKGSESQARPGQKKGLKSSGVKTLVSSADEDGEANGNGHAKSNGVTHSKVNSSSASGSSSDDDNAANKETAFDVNKLAKLRSSKGPRKTVSGLEGPKVASKEDVGSKKTIKKKRVWGDAPPPSKLDFTDPVPKDDGGVEADVAGIEKGLSLMDKDDEDENFRVEDLEEDEEEDVSAKKAAPKKGWLSSLVQTVAGKPALEHADLEPALKIFKERLMTKNVATDIAEKLCESVAASLVGKKQGSFTRISTTVQAAMEEALVRILTPKRSVDILRDVHRAKEAGRPYTIVFVGVNGVGKSTNLAKVAYWLQQHDIKVMMAACDTFRSGAVEQLRTHARRLQIPIFERGYEKDPAVVARDAIFEAKRTKQDVVLVDTAGRMQDNEPLMRALSKLINMNDPDLVLFVGEALVGNDGVHQLTQFNQKLADLSTTSTETQKIDGILLTKFDTIDDKVGAALSMVYISGAPVMFVGCGQSYTDLKKLNVKSVMKSLLS